MHLNKYVIEQKKDVFGDFSFPQTNPRTNREAVHQAAKEYFPVFIFATFFRLTSLLLSLTYLNDFAFLPMGLLWIANLIISILVSGAQGNLNQVNLNQQIHFNI